MEAMMNERSLFEYEIEEVKNLLQEVKKLKTYKTTKEFMAFCDGVIEGLWVANKLDEAGEMKIKKLIKNILGDEKWLKK